MCLVLLRVFISRVFQLILLDFFLLRVFIIMSQGCPLGLAVEPICMQMSVCELAELRWLDTVFQGQYLPSLSINYFTI